MKREEIHEKLGSIFTQASSSEIDWASVTDDTTIESLGFDSLTILDLLFDMEESFGLEVETTEILEIKTVGQMVDFLHEHL